MKNTPCTLLPLDMSKELAETMFSYFSDEAGNPVVFSGSDFAEQWFKLMAAFDFDQRLKANSYLTMSDEGEHSRQPSLMPDTLYQLSRDYEKLYRTLLRGECVTVTTNTPVYDETSHSVDVTEFPYQNFYLTRTNSLLSLAEFVRFCNKFDVSFYDKVIPMSLIKTAPISTGNFYANAEVSALLNYIKSHRIGKFQLHQVAEALNSTLPPDVDNIYLHNCGGLFSLTYGPGKTLSPGNWMERAHTTEQLYIILAYTFVHYDGSPSLMKYLTRGRNISAWVRIMSNTNKAGKAE